MRQQLGSICFNLKILLDLNLTLKAREPIYTN